MAECWEEKAESRPKFKDIVAKMKQLYAQSLGLYYYICEMCHYIYAYVATIYGCV